MQVRRLAIRFIEALESGDYVQTDEGWKVRNQPNGLVAHCVTGVGMDVLQVDDPVRYVWAEDRSSSALQERYVLTDTEFDDDVDMIETFEAVLGYPGFGLDELSDAVYADALGKSDSREVLRLIRLAERSGEEDVDFMTLNDGGVSFRGIATLVRRAEGLEVR